jgi:hypothetical protein
LSFSKNRGCFSLGFGCGFGRGFLPLFFTREFSRVAAVF